MIAGDDEPASPSTPTTMVAAAPRSLVELFDRTGRKPVLTEAGRALLDDARSVHGQVDHLLARAQRMREGVEARLAVAVDVFFPMPKLLTALATRPGRVQTRGFLLQEVWDLPPDLNTRTVDTHVKRLREKLGAASAHVETVRGVGYRLADG